MPKLRAAVPLISSETEAYKRELEAKWGEFLRTQFKRFVGEPLEADQTRWHHFIPTIVDFESDLSPLHHRNHCVCAGKHH